MAQIKPERVTHALLNIAEWRRSVQSQGSTHLFPLLSLLSARAGVEEEVRFEEKDDFAFWDKYLRLGDGDGDKPYFNPVLLRRSEANFPHSNAATIRKSTFDRSWGAGKRIQRDGVEYWALAPNYADIVREKVLTKGGNVARIPALDVAVILFREEIFDDEADSTALETMLGERFPQRPGDYAKIFSFVPEERDVLFQTEGPADYLPAIKDALLVEEGGKPPVVALTPLPNKLDLDDPILQQVEQLINLGTSGIILTGSPGTGKSYYAHRLATHLVSDSSADIFRVQFHPSYGYEDFVEGFRPDDGSTSGFKIVDKVFVKAVNRARKTSGWVVLIIDEINRGDPARVFGEVLTYIERSYRDEVFLLPFSEKSLSIPKNLLILGTMNPHDRSVSHVDAAFVRRFDHIDLPPSREVVEQLLEKAGGFAPNQIQLIGEWFDQAQRHVPFGLGHSYFSGVASVDELKLVWRYRILPAASTAIEIDDGKATNLLQSYEALVRRLEGVVGGNGDA